MAAILRSARIAIMSKPLRVLIVEDSEYDAALLIRAFRTQGYDPTWKIVDMPAALESELRSATWDVILCDYNLPQFGGPAALQILKESGLDLPLIIVSGIIGEDVAVAAMKAGAHDYVPKDNLARLVPAVEREVREAEVRRKRKEVREALEQSEELHRRVLEAVPAGVVHIARDGSIRNANGVAQRILGLSWNELSRLYVADFKNRTIWEDGTECRVEDYPVSKCLATGQAQPATTIGVLRPDGKISWAIFTVLPLFEAHTLKQTGAVVTFLDITERKRVEVALQESETRYRKLVELSPDATFVQCEDKFEFVNSAGARLFGVGKPEELVGKEVLEFVDASSKDAFLRQIRDLKEDDLARPIVEQKLRRLDDTVFDAEVTAAPFAYMGRPAAQVVARDISDRKRAETKLKGSQRQLLEAQSIGQLGSWEWDIPSDKVTWSDELYRIYGLQPHEFDSTYVGSLDRIHPEDRWAVGRIIEKALRDYEPFAYECRIIHPDGQGKFLYSRGQVVLGASGQPIRIIGIGQDITERKRTEATFTAQKRLLESILKQAADAIVVCDAQGKLTLVNDEARRLALLDPKGTTLDISPQVWGQAFDIHGELVPLERWATVKALQGQATFGRESRMVRPDGSYYDVLISATPLRNAQGEIAGAITTFFDITERKRITEALRTTEERFQFALKATNDSVWDWDLSTDALWVDETFQSMFHYGAEQIEPCVAFRHKCIHPEDRERVISGLKGVIDTGKHSWSDEYRFLRSDGSYAHVFDRAHVVYSEKRAPKRVIGAMMDITDRKGA